MLSFVVMAQNLCAFRFNEALKLTKSTLVFSLHSDKCLLVRINNKKKLSQLK
jgi:hypothetical protein